MADRLISLNEIFQGDHVRLVYDPAIEEEGTLIREAIGEVMIAAGLKFIAASSHKSRFGMPRILDLDPKRPPLVYLIERAEEVKARQAAARRGQIVFETPATTAVGLEEQLDTLARLIRQELDDHPISGRKRQLERQFDDLADRIDLARAKRAYILARARVGVDFHPFETRHPAVIRNDCVRPLPSDFETSAPKRKDRRKRLTEAVAIFGEAERETRNMNSKLRALGYDVRRPHPNAQELFIRVRMGAHMTSDIRVFPSRNGLWQCEARAPQNKTEMKAAMRCKREGHVAKLADDMEDLLSA